MTHHRPKGNQPNEGVGRQQAQAQYEGITERLKLIRIYARIDHVEEDRRCLCQARKRVLDGAVCGVELCREVVVGDIVVPRWKGVP